MLDNKTLKESENRVKKFIHEGVIRSRGKKNDVQFFLINAQNSLHSAELLFSVSGNRELQEVTGQLGFNGYLWVINASYYSMFYVTRALLDASGIQFSSDQSIHGLTFDALIYYFHLTGKLEKRLIESFGDAKNEATELLGKEKADELMSNYYYEKNKRSLFTYETGELAMKNKAKTSLERANLFLKEIKKVIKS
jgi:uncharacterized protein (UPF0332 family)